MERNQGDWGFLSFARCSRTFPEMCLAADLSEEQELEYALNLVFSLGLEVWRAVLVRKESNASEATTSGARRAKISEATTSKSPHGNCTARHPDIPNQSPPTQPRNAVASRYDDLRCVGGSAQRQDTTQHARAQDRGDWQVDCAFREPVTEGFSQW